MAQRGPVYLYCLGCGEYFVSLLDEPSDRKNVNHSDKQLWQAEKS